MLQVLVKTTYDKELAIRNFIQNYWMKDGQIYCSNCDENYLKAPEGCEQIICCGKPDYVTNLTAIHRLVYTNKMMRETAYNKFGSNGKKDFRQLYAFTNRLQRDLNFFCMNELNEPFLKDDSEIIDFLRVFPEFRTCEVL